MGMTGDGDPSSDNDDQLIQLEGDDQINDDEPLILECPETRRANKRHIFWIRWICQRPKTMFSITASFHVGVVVASLVLFYTGYDIIHLVVKGMPVYDMNDVNYLRFLAWTRKDPKSQFFIKFSDMYPTKRKKRSLDGEWDAVPFVKDISNDFPYLVDYTHDNVFGEHDSLFPEGMGEKPLAEIPRYSNYVSGKHLIPWGKANFNLAHPRVKRSGKRTCNFWLHQLFDVIYNTGSKTDNILTPKYLGPIQKFEMELKREFQTIMYGNTEYCMCPDPNKGSVLDVFENDLTHIREDVKSSYFLAKNGLIDPETRLPESRITRSYFRICTNASWQNFPLWSWGHEVFLKRAQELADTYLKPEGITISYFSFNVYTDKILKTVLHEDLFLFCGSVLFIFAFMWLQTGSLWITFFGIVSILTSILAANLVYNCAIGYKYLGIFNLLSLFVVLGIGADDIFIFVDTWKLLDGKYDTQEERITTCFKKAGVAMFSTSLTTMVAFFVSSFSSLLTLSSFGTLSGLVVLINYISVMLFFPTVILSQENMFGTKDQTHRCSRITSVCAKSNSCMKGIHDAIVGFFGGIYFQIVTHKYGRFAIIAAFLLFTAGMGLSVGDLKVQDKATSSLLRPDNPYELGRAKASTEFKQNQNDLKVDVFLVWGFLPRNMSPCNKLRYDFLKPCPGKEAMDNNFHLESAKTQMALLGLCNSLSHANATLVKKLEMDIDPSTHKPKVVCIMEAFNMFLKELSKKVMSDISLPVTKEKLEPVLPLLKLAGELDIDIEKVTTPFQTMLWIFLRRSGYAKELNPLAGFKNLTERDKNETIGSYKGEPLHNRRLRYIGVLVPSYRSVMSMGINEGITLMKDWESFMEQKVSTLPDGLKGGFQVAQSWFLLNMKERLVMNAVIGVGVSLGLAFTLLLLTTRNIILAVISLITLSATVVCVIGLMPVMNWKLGPLVALNMCFVAGLAVDYIVHVIGAYQLSDFKSRQDRIQECLRHVGISIISGAITTLGSSFFMLFAKINFFMQFGWFIFCTIGTSLMFSLFFLPALLSVVGPSGEQGSITFLCRRRKRML